MANQPARHYLRIYRIRMENPKAAGREDFRRFVAALEQMDPDAPVKLEVNHHTETARFTDARSGLLLAEWSIGHESANDELQTWCEKVATLGVDMLLQNNLVKRDDFDLAVKLVAEEIRIRLLMRDRPPSDA